MWTPERGGPCTVTGDYRRACGIGVPRLEAVLWPGARRGQVLWNWTGRTNSP